MREVQYKFYCKIIVLLFSCLKIYSLTAQQRDEYFGDIYNDNGKKVELFVIKPKIKCSEGGNLWRYKIRPRGFSPSDTLKKYINWKLRTINCSNYLIERTFSFHVDSIKGLKYNIKDGNVDWQFEADSIVGGIIDGGFYDYANTELDKNLGLISKLVPPDSIYGKREIIEGELLQLDILDENKVESIKWVWYEQACGQGKPVHIGKNYIFTPIRDVELFVRAENGDNYSDCKQVSVIVLKKSKAPESIDLIGGTAGLCLGEKRRLFVVGGELGYGAKWTWYKNVISDITKIGVDSSIDVIPDETTTYVVRAEGVSGNSEPKSIVLSVEKPPLAPLQIISNFQGDPCQNDIGVLTLKVDSNSIRQQFIWKFSAPNKSVQVINLGEEKSLEVIAKESGTFLVAGYSKNCGESITIAKSIKVLPRSVYPLKNEVSATRINQSSKILLKNEGGFLAQYASWRWFELTDTGDSLTLGTGDSIIIKTREPITIGLKPIGGCKPLVDRPIILRVPAIQSAVPVPVPVPVYNVFSIGLITSSAKLQKKLPNIFVSSIGRKIYFKYSIPFLDEYEYETDNTRVLNFRQGSFTGYRYNGQSLSNVEMLVGGIVLKGTNFSRFYIGGGYANRTLLQGFDIYNLNTNRLQENAWGVNLEQSFSGFCIDGGLILKLGDLSFIGGLNFLYSIRRDIGYVSAQLGIGINY